MTGDGHVVSRVRAKLFHLAEVPHLNHPCLKLQRLRSEFGMIHLHGYLAHEKTPPLLEPP